MVDSWGWNHRERAQLWVWFRWGNTQEGRLLRLRYSIALDCGLHSRSYPEEGAVRGPYLNTVCGKIHRPAALRGMKRLARLVTHVQYTEDAAEDAGQEERRKFKSVWYNLGDLTKVKWQGALLYKDDTGTFHDAEPRGFHLSKLHKLMSQRWHTDVSPLHPWRKII